METETREGQEPLQIPDSLPVLPLRDIVIFPFMIVPLYVSRDRSVKAVDSALSENRMICLVAQKEQERENPEVEDLHRIGTVAVIMRMLKLPDGRIRVLVQGMNRAQVEGFPQSDPFFLAKLTPISEAPIEEDSLELEALMRNVKEALEKSVNLGKTISPEVMVIAANLEDPGRLADLAVSNLDLKVDAAQVILETVDPIERLKKVHELIAKEIEVLTMQQQINSQAQGEMDRSQREYFLRQQLKAIQSELGEGNELAEEVRQLRGKARKARMPNEVYKEVGRQISKLERMHPDAAETATLRNYLECMVNLPWSRTSRDNLDLPGARAILDEDHYGLDRIKERILEYLAVRKLKRKMKGPILCFVGPPGVGKTSLGRSIARAVGRKFQRISLGGVRDEAEIRGHRRTYVGSMPGRIIQGIQQAGTSNPVFMLDEVDKIGADYRGDPSSALLEVLDPEQNYTFRDNYLGVPFDLSNVLFIATANQLDPIQPAFLDRMEVIQLTGYTEEEKLQIAKRHLVPKQLEENGLGSEQIAFSDEALKNIVTQYTREAGLRSLEREISQVCRKVARKVAEGREKIMRITASNLGTFLGPPKNVGEDTLDKDQVGVATGLAWTPTGGDVLFVEATAMKGKGELILTGTLGDVMRESARAALSYARSRAAAFQIDEGFFGTHDIHVHIPEGAIPKDGPSAGITMAVAMISVLTNTPIRRNVALTGEITLRGNVLPVGGIKEKVLAARRAKLDAVVLPQLNRRDIEELPNYVKRDIEFRLVDKVDEVLEAALIDGAKILHLQSRSAGVARRSASSRSTRTALQ
ncbi:MAG TPA: endopeptidase La [Vicinamibacteria bacterium]|nr:endopeptidase La [Vicinamibacteria bacterium]